MTNLQGVALCDRAPVPASYLYWRFFAFVLVIVACVVGQVSLDGALHEAATSVTHDAS